MLLCRERLLFNADGPAPSIHVFCDASPLPRGQELFAASFDVVRGLRGDLIERRLFPLVRLSKRMLGASGKLAALLWMIHLIAGKDLYLFINFLSSIRSITTDMGVERLLPDRPGALRKFLRSCQGCAKYVEASSAGSLD